ncbi:MAG: pilus assembly protein [Chloroflexi bacterium]|nr:pilus assembly protein [Chloroflexota bacterium]MCC6897012.1 pilus assembly protein [Anaerolineae bacterium]
MEQPNNRRRRQGQTLAEFAITLPTLLILVFGVIEFGRVFQAWVSLQNAARTAARYASTGQYFEDQFVLHDDRYNDPDSIVPCVDDGSASGYTGDGLPANADRRGTKVTIEPNGTGNGIVNVYTGGVESLFATWYDGKNCDPRDRDDQERRKDMARILSIMLEARRGAAGLQLENNQWSVPADLKTIQTNWQQFPWFQVWQTIPRPPRSDQRYWFNVSICSDRQFVYPDSTPTYSVNAGAGFFPADGVRFITYQRENTLQVNGAVVDPWAPSCLLNENPDPMPVGGFNNAGTPWMDPGGPEDTVFITVSFNHPLITPLGIAPFIPLQARRSAIVETFRSAGNRQGVIFGPPIGANVPTATPQYTDTPTPTFTYTPISTRTPTATYTPSPEPDLPFDCTRLTLANRRLINNNFVIDVQNDNVQTTYITRVRLTWPNIPSVAQMALTQMALNGSQNWVGNHAQGSGASTTTDTDSIPGNPPFASTSTSIRELTGGDVTIYSAAFNSGGALSNYVSVNSYAVTLSVFNPLNAATPCILTSPATIPTATPTIPGQPSPTRTPTPDCASSLIGIRFNSFDNFGLVRYDILSQRTTTSTLVSFIINWQKYVNSQRLVKVSLGAPPGQAGAVVVWDSANVNQDSTPPTNSRTEGTWLTNYTLPAGRPGNPSITPIYFDFEGIYRYDDYTGSTSPKYGGPSDFNFSEFELTCGTPGGSAGSTSGGQPTGRITPENNPTPTNVPTQGPTNTPKPTNTPAPTLTPSRTPTRGPNTATFTPRPPTATPPPTNTQAPMGPPTAATGN